MTLNGKVCVIVALVGCWQDRDVIRTEYVRTIQYRQCMEMTPPDEEPEIDCWNDPDYTTEQCITANLLHQAEDGIHLREWACRNLQPCGVVCDSSKP